jgi:hypothetical protein
MTSSIQERGAALRSAAQRAALAPSIHNTQPWRFRIRGDVLEMLVDPDRQLEVIDPGSRQLTISCGCALFNARVGVAARRYSATVERFPDPADPALFARLILGEPAAPWTPLVRLDGAIERRRSNRREFFEHRVSEEVLWELTAAAAAEDAVVVTTEVPARRRILAELIRESDAIESADPEYRAELQRWTTTMSTRPDGVSARSFPQHITGDADVRLRDFADPGTGSGQMPPVTESGLDQCLLVLGTATDDRFAWLRAGEALQRLWLEATRLDHVASIISQPVEVRQTRRSLRDELELTIWPQIVLRVGQAAPNVATRRRDLGDVLDEAAPEPTP